MKVYSQLEKAQLENTTSSPASDAEGMISYRTDNNEAQVSDGTVYHALADVDSAQVFTNKDYNGGTASDTSRITVPKDTIANLDGLTRKEGTVVYATDLQQLYYDDGSNLLPIGAGSGTSGVNYIDNPDAEVDTTGWAVYADAAGQDPVDGTGGSANVTITASATDPLRGSKSFLLTKDAANRQGEGVSYDFTIERADLAKVLRISFDYEGSTDFDFGDGTVSDVSDVTFWVYDVTNATLIPVTPLVLDGSGKYIGEFQTASDSTSYRLIAHIATTNASAWTFKFDNVQVGPQSKVIGVPATDWQENWTPTGSWSTNTTYTGSWRRVGDSIQIKGTITLSGAPDSATLAIDLPNGYSIDSDKESGSGFAYLTDSGTPANNTMATLEEASGDDTQVTMKVIGAGDVDESSPFTFASGDTIEFFGTFPIAGWGAAVGMSADSDTRVVSATVYDTQPSGTIGATHGASGVTIFDTIEKDTHGMYNSGTGIFTAPVTGWYRVSGQVAVEGTEASNHFVAVSMDINGTQDTAQQAFIRVESASLTSTFLPFTLTKFLSAGDELNIRTRASISSPGFQSLAGAHHMTVEKMSGPATIAATEFVGAKYTMATGSETLSSGSNAQLDFDTEVYDTHSAVSGAGTGLGGSWQFTCPESGYYEVKAMHALQSASGFNGTGESYRLWVTINDVAQEHIDRKIPSAGALTPSLGGSGIYKCQAGDVIKLLVRQNSGNNADTATTDGSVSVNWASITKVNR